MAVKQFTTVTFVPQPSAPSVTPNGADDSETYGYKIVAVKENGTHSEVSSEGTTSNGASALSSSDSNTLTWTDPPNTFQIEIYRTTGGATQGFIALVDAGVETYTDEGDVADGTTAPATNTTGLGNSLDVLGKTHQTIQCSGTFVSDNQVQGSIDNVNWEDVGSAFSDVGILSVSSTFQFLRIKQTDYTSGTANFFLGYRRENA